MKLTLNRVTALVGLAGFLCLLAATGAGAVLGALGRHSARFPLNHVNRAADSIWNAYLDAKGGPPAAVSTGDDLTFSTIFTSLHGQVFQIPLADRGGEGGATTSMGDDVVLLTHDGRFFSGSASAGFRQVEDVQPPANGYQDYFDRTHREPYDPSDQNYANFRYNDLAFFRTATGAGLLISYTYYDAARECYANRLSRFDLPDASASFESLAVEAEDWRLLLETKPCFPLNRPPGPSIYVQEAAGRMVVEPATNTIYLAGGNYDVPIPESGTPIPQDPSNDYGKVLAVDLDTGASRHVAIGFRNPQGIAQDQRGRIWTVGHGPRGGDELNLIAEGHNYGFPHAVYGTTPSGGPYPGVRTFGRHDGFERPIFAWLPSIGTGALMSVRGFHPTWDGDLLVGAMVGQKLVHIRLFNDRVVFTEDIPVGRRVRHLNQHTDGSIILWNGKNELIVLTPSEPSDAPSAADAIVASLDAPADVRAAVQVKLGECQLCHSLEPGVQAAAPSLAEVFGSDVGSAEFAFYSPAMAAAGGRWTEERLSAFLQNPNGVIPGTTMPDPGIQDEDVRAALVEALQKLSASP